MSRRSRLILSAALSLMAVSGIMVAIALGGKRSVPTLQPEVPLPMVMAHQPNQPAETRQESPVSQDHSFGATAATAVRIPEPLIEEEVAEFEEPGAVYYTSRIREAIAEGNPRFGRELLRQMKELHSESVLVGEAETLLEQARRTGSR